MDETFRRAAYTVYNLFWVEGRYTVFFQKALLSFYRILLRLQAAIQDAFVILDVIDHSHHHVKFEDSSLTELGLYDNFALEWFDNVFGDHEPQPNSVLVQASLVIQFPEGFE